MRKDGDRRSDAGGEVWSGGFPATWQGWALIGVLIGVLAAVQLLVPRSNPVHYPVFAIGGAVVLASLLRKTRIGRRWLERLKAALPDEPGRKRRTRRERR